MYFLCNIKLLKLKEFSDKTLVLVENTECDNNNVIIV